MYPLLLTASNPVNNYMIGSYRVVILTDCETSNRFRYTYVALVHPENDDLPIFAVTSEENPVAFGHGGSHILCVYEDKRYRYGISSDWADLEKFTEEALSLITKHYVASTNNKTQTPEARQLYWLVNNYQRKLKAIDPETHSNVYGLTQFKLGEAYSNLSNLEAENNDLLLQSIDAYQAALGYLSNDEYVEALTHIATNYVKLSIKVPSEENWIKAYDAYQAEIAELKQPAAVMRPRGPLQQPLHLDRNLSLGKSYRALGNIFVNLNRISDANDALRLAQKMFQKCGLDKWAEVIANEIASLPPAKSTVKSTLPQPRNVFATSIPAEQLRLLINNTISVKTGDPSEINDWRQKLLLTQQAATSVDADKDFIAALLAVLDDQPASLPSDNIYQTILAKVIGEIALFRLSRKENLAHIAMSQDTFTHLFLEASDLPDHMTLREDHRRKTLQPRDLPFERCNGLHSGLAVWTGDINDPLARVVDIRWTFPNEDAAYAYHYMALATNCEGQSGTAGAQPVGSEGFVFGGASKDPLFGMQFTQFFYLFRVKQTVIKLYAAEGDRLPPGQKLTADLVKPIAEKIVSRILSVQI